MSKAELYREIAQLVNRAVAGEAVDPTAAGESLARRFPHLLLSGELLGKAVARAAGMVGVALTGAESALAPPVYRASDAALWFAQPDLEPVLDKPTIPTRGWFAPPKAGAMPAPIQDAAFLAADGPQPAQA